MGNKMTENDTDNRLGIVKDWLFLDEEKNAFSRQYIIMANCLRVISILLFWYTVSLVWYQRKRSGHQICAGWICSLVSISQTTYHGKTIPVIKLDRFILVTGSNYNIWYRVSTEIALDAAGWFFTLQSEVASEKASDLLPFRRFFHLNIQHAVQGNLYYQFRKFDMLNEQKVATAIIAYMSTITSDDHGDCKLLVVKSYLSLYSLSSVYTNSGLVSTPFRK